MLTPETLAAHWVAKSKTPIPLLQELLCLYQGNVSKVSQAIEGEAPPMPAQDVPAAEEKSLAAWRAPDSPTDKDRILTYVRENPGLNGSVIRAALALDLRRWNSLQTAMKKTGLLRKEGGTKAARWFANV